MHHQENDQDFSLPYPVARSLCLLVLLIVGTKTTGRGIFVFLEWELLDVVFSMMDSQIFTDQTILIGIAQLIVLFLNSMLEILLYLFLFKITSKIILEKKESVKQLNYDLKDSVIRLWIYGMVGYFIATGVAFVITLILFPGGSLVSLEYFILIVVPQTALMALFAPLIPVLIIVFRMAQHKVLTSQLQ